MRSAGYQYGSAVNPAYARNLLRNGDGVIVQRGSSIAAPNDDVYIADGWIVLQESNGAVDFDKETTSVPTGGRSSIRLTVNTANEKFGIFQPISSEDTDPFLDPGDTIHLSLSFDARQGAGDTIASIYGAIVSWASTADTIASDIVGVWEDSSTAPTLAANWAYEGRAPASLGVPSGTFTRYKVEGVTVDTASVANLGVFIWQNDTASVAATDLLDISNVMLNVGKFAAPYERRSMADEWTHCERYFQTTYNNGVAPGTVTNVGRLVNSADRAVNFGAGGGKFQWDFSNRMRVTPTVTAYAPLTGTSGFCSGSTTGDITTTSLNPGERGTGFALSGAEDPAANETLSVHGVADADL